MGTSVWIAMKRSVSYVNLKRELKDSRKWEKKFRGKKEKRLFR